MLGIVLMAFGQLLHVNLPADGVQIRLVGGNGRCSGRVEVYQGHQWGTVCDDDWDMNDAAVVCRELGCGTALSAPGGEEFGQGTGEIWMDDVDCSGSESSLSQCSHTGLGEHNCDHEEDAGAVCSGLPIRLVDGNGRCSGRVEVYHRQQWGTVCDDDWDMNDAAVVCRELGCGTALSAPGAAQLGQGTGEIWMDDVGCSGSESSLSQCSHRGFGEHNCGHGQDAGAVCSGLPIRLVDGNGRCSGRVEVYQGHQWGTVCDNDWDMNDAAVVCRELGCGTALSAPVKAQFDQGTGEIWMDDVGCSGNESSLSQCSHTGFGDHNCGHEQDAGAVCSGPPIRLVGGNGSCSGRVEVYHEQQWGTVCDDGWDMNDAAVVCRELGCGTALSAPGAAQFGQGTGEIWMHDFGCSGSESSLSQCSHTMLGENYCDHEEDAGAVCSDPSIRLVGGNGRCSGRVEVYHGEQWGTVCDDDWDMNDAAVVCRELGCGTALSVPGVAQFGQGTGEIWMDDVGCSGNESSLSQCSHRGFGEHNCGHGQDAGAVCSGLLIRLVGGNGSCSGRVEVYHEQQWGTVCDDDWDMNDAAVVCRELGCGTALSAPGVAQFGQGTGEIWMHDFGCSGSESSLSQCSHTMLGENYCDHEEDAGAVCSGPPIRLVDGNGRCSGRVEVYQGHQWGTVCDNDWDMNDAAVVCRELGCGTALSAPGGAKFGQGTGEIWMDDVGCSGNESSLSQCSYRGFGEHNCGHEQDAGAVCAGLPIRLVGGNGSCSGRVEVYHRQQWGTVCDDDWDMNDAAVVCRELGCGTALSAPGAAQFGQGTGEIWMDDVGCSGSESSLSQCSHRGLGEHDCDHGEDAGAVCSGPPIRLVSGNGSCSGRVEVYHGEQWGTVCDNDWDMNDAAVVCRELGCGTALSAPVKAQFDQGTGEIWMDDVGCSGNESSLSQCSHTGFGEHNCGHGQDAGAVCSGLLIRLVGGNGSCCGRVEVYQGQQWGTVCDDDWDMNDAAVVCRELGCGTALSAPVKAQFGQGTGEIWMDDVGCSGNESSLSQCSHTGFGEHNCGHEQDAGAVCSGQLLHVSLPAASLILPIVLGASGGLLLVLVPLVLFLLFWKRRHSSGRTQVAKTASNARTMNAYFARGKASEEEDDQDYENVETLTGNSGSEADYVNYRDPTENKYSEDENIYQNS